jgi:glutaredoxin
MSKLPPIDLDWPPPAPPSQSKAVDPQPLPVTPQPLISVAPPRVQSAAPLYPESRPRCSKHALLLDNKGECARCQQPKLSATWVYLLVIAALVAIGMLFVVTRVLGFVREFAQTQEELQRGAGASGVRGTHVQSARVVMYTTSTCPACRSAKSWLAENKVAYDERVLDTDEQAIREYSKLGARVVPTFVIDGQVLAGFSASQIQAALAKPKPAL